MFDLSTTSTLGEPCSVNSNPGNRYRRFELKRIVVPRAESIPAIDSKRSFFFFTKGSQFSIQVSDIFQLVESRGFRNILSVAKFTIDESISKRKPVFIGLHGVLLRVSPSFSLLSLSSLLFFFLPPLLFFSFLFFYDRFDDS